MRELFGEIRRKGLAQRRLQLGDDAVGGQARHDLAEVQKSLVARRQLAGYEMKDRFYEIGSHEGLNELDALLRAAPAP